MSRRMIHPVFLVEGNSPKYISTMVFVMDSKKKIKTGMGKVNGHCMLILVFSFVCFVFFAEVDNKISGQFVLSNL
jgi:hypothetical protein